MKLADFGLAVESDGDKYSWHGENFQSFLKEVFLYLKGRNCCGKKTRNFFFPQQLFASIYIFFFKINVYFGLIRLWGFEKTPRNIRCTQLFNVKLPKVYFNFRNIVPRKNFCFKVNAITTIVLTLSPVNLKWIECCVSIKS